MAGRRVQLPVCCTGKGECCLVLHIAGPCVCGGELRPAGPRRVGQGGHCFPPRCVYLLRHWQIVAVGAPPGDPAVHGNGPTALLPRYRVQGALGGARDLLSYPSSVALVPGVGLLVRQSGMDGALEVRREWFPACAVESVCVVCVCGCTTWSVCVCVCVCPCVCVCVCVVVPRGVCACARMSGRAFECACVLVWGRRTGRCHVYVRGDRALALPELLWMGLFVELWFPRPSLIEVHLHLHFTWPITPAVQHR
jgi:hypothetical protein